MAQTIKIKRSSTSGNKLTSSNSVAGELGLNTADKALYIQTGSSNGDVVTVAHESTLKIDESNNRVGIGTTSPGVELEVAGANPILRIRENDQTNRFGDILVNSTRIRIRSRAGSNNGSIAFEGNNGSTTTEYARFNPNGYLGIGETDPSAPLHIGGDGRVAIFGDDSFDDKYIELREGGTTGFRMGLRTNLVDSSGCILLQTGDDKGFGIAVNTTAAWGSVATSSIPFYVAEGGSVGIGTTAPSYHLHVDAGTNNSTALFEADGVANVVVSGGNNRGSFVVQHSGTTSGALIAKSGGGLEFGVGANYATNVRMVLDSNGAVTFNDAFTFPTAIGSAGQVLKVPTSGTTLYWADEAAASAGTSMSDADGDTKIQVEESADEDKIRFDTAGTERVIIDDTGKVGIGTSLPEGIMHFSASSDYDIVFDNTSEEKFKLRHGTSGIYLTGPDTDTLAFGVDQSHDVKMFSTSGSAYATFDGSTSRVGIGTTTPSYPFDVHVGDGNTVNFTSTDNRMQIRIKDNDTTGYVGVENSTFYLGLNAGIGTNNLSIKSDGGVGIGTFAPNRQLHISGSGVTVAAKVEATDGSQSSIDLKNSEGEFRIINDGGELSIYDQTDTTERLRIDTAGFVGIGTNNPFYQLDVHTTTGTGLRVKDDNGWATIRVEGGGDTDNVLELANYGSAGSGSLIRTTGTGHLRLFAGNTEAIRIDGTTQNVGIGITTPSRRLDVSAPGNDGIRIASTNALIGAGASGGDTQLIYWNGSNAYYGRNALGGSVSQHEFRTGGTTRLTIKSDGKVGIGTTSPSQKLQVAGTILADTALAASSGTNAIGIGPESAITDTSSTYRIKLLSNSNDGKLTTYAYGSYLTLKAGVDGTNYANNWSKIELRDGGGVGSNNAHMKFYTHGDERMVIDNDGNVGIGSTDPQNVLDLGVGTHGRGIAWGGSNGTAHYNTIWSEYSSASIIIGAGLKGATGSSTFLNPFTGTYGYAAIELDSFSDDGIKFYTGADSARTKDAAITPTEQMRLDNSGRLGIGTSSPAYQLDVTGTGRFTGAVTLDSTLSFGFATAVTALDLNNNNIIDVNNISFSDPGANEGLQWNNVRIFESPDDLTNAAGNLQVTYGGTRRLTVNNTGIDVNGTITGATNISKQVARTVTGGTDTENGPNTWAKLATYSVTNNYNDGTFIYGVVTEEQSLPTAGTIIVRVRWGDLAGSINPEVKVEWTSKNSGNTLGTDAFKLIGDGVSDDIELWVQKDVNYGCVELWELAYRKEDSNNVSVSYENNSAWQSSTPTGTAVNETSGTLTFDGKEVIVGDNFTNVTDVTIDGRVTTDTLTLKKYGGDTITLTPDPAFSNAPSHGIVHTGYQITLGDYITLKSAGNSTSGHGVIGVADNGVYFGKTDVENSSHQMSNSATAPLDTTYGFINSSGLNTSKLAINTLTPHSGTRAQICAGSTSFSMNSTAISNTTLVLSNSDDDYGTVFATGGTGKGYIQQRRTATATYYDLSLQPYGGNLGIGTDAPTQYINTGSYFKPDASGKFLTVNGGGNGSFIMLESTSNTSGDQIGGLYFTDGTGQSDAHRQVAAIDAIVAPHGTNNALSGADLRLFTKPIGGGATDPRMTIKSTGFVGINTNNPAYQLDLSSGTTNIAARFFSTDATTNLMLQDNTATTYFSSSAGNAYFGGSAGLSANNLTLVQSTGNVGIGDYTPNFKLHVNSGTTNVAATFESSDNEAWIQLRDDGAGAYGCLIGFDSDNSNLFKIADSSVNTKFTLKSTGRVGIGIEDPTEMLEVYTNGPRSVVRIHEDAGSDVARLHLRTGGNDTHIQNHPSTGFEIRTENNLVNADPALRIQGGGNATFGYDVKIKELGIDTTETSTSATTEVAIDSFAAATFRSARYTIQVTNNTDSTYHITEILLIHNGTTPQITEYGTIFTGSAEATFDADISSGNVRLLATPATTDSMTFKVVRHCITV